jgi:hypothetical protein
MEDSDEDFMSAEEDQPPNKFSNNTANHHMKNYDEQQELLVDGVRRASSFDR